MQHLLKDEMWRGMLGSMVIPALLYLTVIFFIPESPRWLIVKGKTGKAAGTLARIYSSREMADEQIAETHIFSREY